MVRYVLASALTLLAVLLPAGAAQSAVQDPERNSITPAGWAWYHGQTAKEINAIRAKGMRLIEIEVQKTKPYRFAASFVRNEGVHERPQAGWYYDKSASELEKLTPGRRFVDIETYKKDGKRRFAVATIRNKGEAFKEWWWNYDLSQKQVKADIDKHGIRLVDLNAYEMKGKRRYSYVGIKNHGVDARAWWVYYRVKEQEMLDLARENQARIIDVERLSKKLHTVVMVDSRGEYSVTGDFTAQQLEQTAASRGSRIIELEKTGDRWVAVLLDNSDAETDRIRDYIEASPYAAGYFGAYSKAVDGRVYVGLAHDSPYQPMSVMKLVPFLYVLDRVDRGLSKLEDELTWQRPPGMPDDPCPGDGPSETFSTDLGSVLDRAMKISLNRAHETLLDEFKPHAITSFVRGDAIGMKSTRMYYGCPGKTKKDWTSSRTTLADMGRLFEGVDSRRFFKHQWDDTSALFYDILVNWGDDPESPDNWYRDVVADEAAKLGKSAFVDQFLEGMQVDGKGGSLELYEGDPAEGTAQVPRAFSFRALLPFPGWPDGRPFVGGFFASPLTGVCVEADWEPNWWTSRCRAFRDQMKATFEGLTAELLRVPIREALAAIEYPSPPPSSPQPADPPVTGPPSGGLPDLVLAHDPQDAPALIVRNTGTAAAGPFKVRVNRDLIDFPDGLAAGAQERRAVGCRGETVGRADEFDTVEESDESNNALSWICHE